MTSRALADAIQNALDFLTDAELVLYANSLSRTDTTVGWHAAGSGAPFILNYSHATAEQYLSWVISGEYSAALRDGSLLQLSYRLRGNVVVGHRLAYVPCPVVVDQELLDAGEPIADVVPLYLNDPNELTLRSPVRFDFDLGAADVDHPAAHFSINSADCRIACIAPVHPYRFIDFVFRHFYPWLRRVHQGWFEPASTQDLGKRVITEDDRKRVHLTWPIDAV
jgi:hypothetical protein